MDHREGRAHRSIVLGKVAPARARAASTVDVRRRAATIDRRSEAPRVPDQLPDRPWVAEHPAGIAGPAARTEQPDMEPQPIRVALCGILGRMGQEMYMGLSADPGISVVGGCDPRAAATDTRPPELAGPTEVVVRASLAELLDAVPVDVVVDFTTAEAAAQNAATALGRRTPIVIGTTGLTDQEQDEIDALARRCATPALVAPNFAIGAVLLFQFAKMASKFFDFGEVIEIHHDGKIDAPSGTAIQAAQMMRSGRDQPFSGDNVSKFVVPGTRGGVTADVHIHSLRMPGFVASHQAIFGGPGQSLTIRHDSIGRDSFVPGVAFAVKNIRGRSGLVRGLDQLMDLS